MDKYNTVTYGISIEYEDYWKTFSNVDKAVDKTLFERESAGRYDGKDSGKNRFLKIYLR